MTLLVENDEILNAKAKSKYTFYSFTICRSWNLTFLLNIYVICLYTFFKFAILSHNTDAMQYVCIAVKCDKIFSIEMKLTGYSHL